MEIKNKRIKLREINKKDKEDIIETLDNLNVSKWLLVFPHPFKPEDAEKTINKAIKNSKEKPRKTYNLGIELKEKLIGGIGLVNINFEQKTAGIMYWLGEEFQKKGYGTEALESILNFAFNDLKLRKVTAEVYPGNNPSTKLLEKFNFKKEGYLRKSKICKADGKIKDSIYYGLLKEEYK